MHRRIFTLLVFFAVSSFAQFAAAQKADSPAFAALEGSNFKVLSYEACKASYFSVDFNHPLRFPLPPLNEISPFSLGEKWIPNGAPERLEPLGCAPEDLERLYITSREDSKIQGKRLQKWFLKCSDGLKTELASSLLAGPRAQLRAASVQYQFCDNPNIRKVVFKLPNGDTVRAVLGLKPGWKPRPLIIAKCGMLCNSDDAGIRMLLMHLFDESPFNVMVIGNNTGADFVRDNGVFIPGGFTEGQQIFQVARLLKASPLSPIISSFHVVGLSLGGHASLYAAYLNRYNSASPKKPLIASTLAACPAVDLHAAIQDNFSLDPKGLAINILYEKSIELITKTRPELAGLFAWANAPVNERTELVGAQAVRSLKHYPANSQLAPFKNMLIRNTGEFWGANYFRNFAREPFASPTLALAAADDEVVDPRKNIKALNRSSVIQAISPAGDHCLWDEFYGWRTTSALFRGFILSQSPELLENRQIERSRFTSVFPANTRRVTGLQRLTTFAFQPGKDGLLVTRIVETDHCTSDEGPRCIRNSSFIIPFTSLETRPWWAHRPATAAEAEALTRWANVNLRMLGADGFQTDGSMNDGVELAWLRYSKDL